MASNYPAGAEYDPNAPYNQVDPEPVDFDVDVCYVLTKPATISSDNYIGGYRDDEGFYEDAEYQGDVNEDYKAQFLTPLDVMNEYSSYCANQIECLKAELEHTENINDKRAINKQIDHYKLVIESCDDWEEEFEEV